MEFFKVESILAFLRNRRKLSGVLVRDGEVYSEKTRNGDGMWDRSFGVKEEVGEIKIFVMVSLF